MNWIESISKSLEYIENNIMEDITTNDIANHVFISPFYFQKGFSIMCGYSISEYIRDRKLSLAGEKILNTQSKIIDIALKYGYDSPDSFTKAFTRFHGVTPTQVRKGGKISYFAPLKINLTMKGGYIMEYKIEEKESFKVIGLKGNFKYEKANEDIPKLWKKFFMKTAFNKIKPKYAINIDTNMGCDSFNYIIGDDYNSDLKITSPFEVVSIPKYTWAIFSCIGPSNKKIPEMNEKIFKEWLPNSNDYEIAAGYNIEKYSNPKDFKKGINEKNTIVKFGFQSRKKTLSRQKK